ncbi:Rok-like winged helix domain-containing protein [Domibacillus epiphyticus]|uniref:Competence protein ComK n=1 Tax=Domibacillus epiphyticus TaxID=1714355 RepID=A0A1V2A502_9BACI|nr:hypothetical protein [Domibacillus epiphyticus]OMP66075.1 hypothetical protein BTO28_13800 [Domibacillus epiphyticus]
MFDERIALKIRLDQLADAEIRVIQEFKKERDKIFARLQELDGASQEISVASITTIGPPPKARRGRRSESLVELRETAVGVLKEQNTPIRGVELQRFVEERTGKKIANMTTFMNGLERENERVRKLGRGLYIYEYGM